MNDAGAVLGIFVGGRGSRMGGVQKALLPAPDTQEALALRLARLGRAAGLAVVLVGTAGELGPELGALPQLPDDPPGIGPLGGLAALLEHASARPALAVACDLPFVSAALLSRLAGHPSSAPLLGPRDAQSGKWQPLFARYQPAQVLPVVRALQAGPQRSLQALYARLPAEELQLTAAEQAQLRDWDTPEDLQRQR